MAEIKKLRLHLLRAMYLLISLGLALTIWPEIIFPSQRLSDESTVIQSLLGALALFSALGLRYPIKMIPILLFELTWKLIWILAFALPVWATTELDIYTEETLFACLIGVILVPIVIPWKYVYKQYINTKTKL